MQTAKQNIYEDLGRQWMVIQEVSEDITRRRNYVPSPKRRNKRLHARNCTIAPLGVNHAFRARRKTLMRP